jgi:cation:H+ antiporter
MLIPSLFVLGGLLLLAAGAEALVRGSSALALRLGVTPLVVGLTVVAFGTGSPELFVSVEAAYRGDSGIALGNVVGSNIGNVALILGLAALARPLKVRSELIRREVPLMIGVTLLLCVLLYGGITEELLLRWGLMTLLVWAAWRLLQRSEGEPKSAYVVGVILISSLIFGVGHLPVAYMILPEATFALTLFVIVANSVFGLIAGYLYWKKGLESAMLAHMLTHILLLAASYSGAYF